MTQRERVVLARRRGARQVRTRTEVVEQTELGAALIGGLIRAQLGLALRISLVVVIGFGCLPLLFAVDPVANATVAGVRLPWLILGALAFPALYAVGHLYTRLAQRNEDDFARVVSAD
ncbi:hypothetical protein [Nocardia camponoti]|uniref:Membrane protein n=1 Tax=Nocardia camponoti TaxID=1616106 RepID=A0A917QSU2_9NOCA|nr:hypothetical protein [Nocardia camponoti]GGK65677.1 membrane protein [Nocardia camponoti]